MGGVTTGAAPRGAAARGFLRGRPARLLLVLLVFPLTNALLNKLVFFTTVPLFMDSILTAVAAALFGVLPGLAVAVLTNVFQEAFHGFAGRNLPFALCGAATALIVGLWARRGGFRTLGAAFLASIAVALANSLLGSAIAVFVYGGTTASNIDNLVAAFALVTDSILSAAFLARFPMNLVDKTIAVFAAWGLLAAWRKAGESVGKPVGDPSPGRDRAPGA